MCITDITIEPRTYKKFSGGEVHPAIDAMPSSEVTIWCLDYSSDGFMAVCNYNEILRRNGCNTVRLVYPYLPYARQDRVTSTKEPFSLRVFANLLNSQTFDSVTIYDPHSYVSHALIERCRIVPQEDIFKECMGYHTSYMSDPNLVLVSPDAGAYSKISKIKSGFDKICVATKIRSPDNLSVTCNITNPEILKGSKCFIVDDICDGGRTFIDLAKKIRQHDPESISLFVTHGIFSRGIDSILEFVDKIHTTDSFVENKLIEDKRVHVYSIRSLRSYERY